VDHAQDAVVEMAGQGRDRIEADVSYVLPAHVEALVLLGSRGLTATGNALDNELTGNDGANTLDGKEGADRMAGGLGNDSYVVDDAGDQVIEVPGAGVDAVFASVDHVLAVDVENLTLTGSAPLSGVGNALANTLTGNAAGSSLGGEAGNDTLNGGAGDDVLRGGQDNDTLTGGGGADLYLFERGDGQDALVENDATQGVADVLRFGDGVEASQVWFSKSGKDLEVSIIGTADRITVSNWYRGAERHVELFELASGERLTDAQVQSLVDAMSGFAPPPLGQVTLVGAYEAALASVIDTAWV
jgi:Ca2+-binding RTX toxin-like protein